MKKILSVIIPIYNVEDYLEETILNVINQSIGFKDNIELVLINDGSSDNSGEICLKYKEKYPDNVVYVEQENGGVSKARNNGIEHATCKYVTFLDSDDLWDENAFEVGVLKLEQDDSLSACLFPMKFFEAKTYRHPLSRGFKEDKVVNLLEDDDVVQMSSCCLILRKDCIKNYRYVDNLKIGEDARFINEILLDSPKVQIIKNIFYNYRSRLSESSAMQSTVVNKGWYFDTTEKLHLYMIDLSLEKFGEVIHYIQEMFVYDLHWRMNAPMADFLTDKEKKEYLTRLRKILSYVDDSVIANSIYLDIYEKLYMLVFKYDKTDIFTIKDDVLYVNDVEIVEVNKLYFKLDSFSIHGDKVEMFGRNNVIPSLIDDLFIKVKNDYIKMDTYELDKKNAKYNLVDDKYGFKKVGVKATIDLTGINEFTFNIKVKNNYHLIAPRFSSSSRLSNSFSSLFLRSKSYFIKYLSLKKIVKLYKKSLNNYIKLELKCRLNLLKKKKWKYVLLRILVNWYELFKKKEVWLVSDRIQVAGDNGEAFFNYLMKINDKKIKYYFVLHKDSKDFGRLKEKYGKHLLKYNSLKHKVLFLTCDKIISAHADAYVTNHFGGNKKFVSDYYRFRYIFLQHGITKDDLSPWLNVNSKHIDMFITAAKPEYKSLISGEYRYNFPNDNVKLTGFARFDKLVKKDKVDNVILISPTWRASMTSNIDRKTGKRLYNAEFKHSDYFKFYNELLNNKDLIKKLKENDYKIRFIPHPNMKEQIKDFDSNDYVDIVTESINYSEEFINNKILVTDFSSVMFDFAYLDKPIVMCQFDKEEFFKGQIYDQGYFDFEKDGFGPVTYNVKDTVKEIINLIDRDGKIEDKYKKRINNFYKYHDQDNSKRIYDEIIKMDRG